MASVTNIPSIDALYNDSFQKISMNDIERAEALELIKYTQNKFIDFKKKIYDSYKQFYNLKYNEKFTNMDLHEFNKLITYDCSDLNKVYRGVGRDHFIELSDIQIQIIKKLRLLNKQRIKRLTIYYNNIIMDIYRYNEKFQSIQIRYNNDNDKFYIQKM